LLDAYLVYNGTANDLVLTQRWIHIKKMGFYNFATGNTNDPTNRFNGFLELMWITIE
jgi:hypothetical protein